MKKIKIPIIIVSTSIISLALVFVSMVIGIIVILFTDVLATKDREITIVSYDKQTVLDLGVHEVGFIRSKNWYEYNSISFSVKDTSSFYSNVIYTSEYYASSVSDETLGYLIVDNHYFQYSIENNSVSIIVIAESTYSKDLDLNIIVPFSHAIFYKDIEMHDIISLYECTNIYFYLEDDEIFIYGIDTTTYEVTNIVVLRIVLTDYGIDVLYEI